MPIPALWLAYMYVRRVADIRLYLSLYVILGALISSGIIASYNGVKLDMFEPIGKEPMAVYDKLLGIVPVYCGFLRSPEVAAWHAATVASLSVILFFSFRRSIFKLLSSAIVTYAVYSAMLTGRRKFLAVMMAFAALYFLGLFYFSNRTVRRATFVGTLTVGILLLPLLVAAPERGPRESYVVHSATTIDDSWDRLYKSGIGSVYWALNTAGPFGLGNGIGSQGAAGFVGKDMDSVRGAAEGGLGRIVLELGLLGLFLAVACGVAVARQLKRCVGLAAQYDVTLMRLTLGLVCFIAANVPVFIGAQQIYGDPFVLIILGLLMGFVLSVPRIIRLNQARDDQRHIESAHPFSLSRL